MQEEAKKEFNDLMNTRNWVPWVIVGVVLLVAVSLKPVLVLLAIAAFLRALYLAYPTLIRKLNER